jgi:hypothetical protein
MPNKIRLFKTPSCPAPDKATLAIVVRFLQFALQELGIQEQEVKIRLLGANPGEPITTGAYSPHNKTIATISGNRHPIDYCRTIAHELAHMKQDLDGRVTGVQQEIGGEIEDEANAKSGQIVKAFIKSKLTTEEKKLLGLGTF